MMLDEQVSQADDGCDGRQRVGVLAARQLHNAALIVQHEGVAGLALARIARKARSCHGPASSSLTQPQGIGAEGQVGDSDGRLSQPLRFSRQRDCLRGQFRPLGEELIAATMDHAARPSTSR